MVEVARHLRRRRRAGPGLRQGGGRRPGLDRDGQGAMSEASVGADGDEFGPERREAIPGAAAWLGLAAAPTFAIMALLTGVADGGPTAAMCAPAHGAPLLGGMVPMYLLMSA